MQIYIFRDSNGIDHLVHAKDMDEAFLKADPTMEFMGTLGTGTANFHNDGLFPSEK